MSGLAGRTAVVTGGSTGIGRATALRLAEAGCRVAICARSEGPLREAERVIRDAADAAGTGAGAEVLALVADVSREADVERLRGEVEARLGPADILVNNAGLGVFGSILDLDPEDYDRVFGANVRGVFLCARTFASGMAERGDGVIVNVASLAGKNAFAGGSVYAASKHAVLGMSKCMMLDLRPRGVRVVAICPGTVMTPFFDDQDRFDPDPEKALRAEDVAATIVHAVETAGRATLSEIEIRPVSP
ncbi:MAG: SDR family NAD(P)-dependent oxidoreductase [Gemmatimonadota bacterium]|nr:SDR family NAD(P)-dependent oxidoreductase [Gemmatimonadota bacterium]